LYHFNNKAKEKERKEKKRKEKKGKEKKKRSLKVSISYELKDN